jgi:membrane-associated phospholipid phosphatase
MDPTAVARWRVFCLVMLGAFLGTSAVVYAVGLLPGDGHLHREVLLARGTLAHAVARWLNYGGRWEFLAPAMLALLVWSPIARGRWWLWCGIIPLAGGFEQLFKVIVGRPRPRGINWGFPSGHVTAVATFVVLTLYLLSRERVSPAVRIALLPISIALIASVGYARIILNAHWPSDVLGGAFLGAGCAAGAAWWDATHPADDAQPRAAVNDTVRIGG